MESKSKMYKTKSLVLFILLQGLCFAQISETYKSIELRAYFEGVEDYRGHKVAIDKKKVPQNVLQLFYEEARLEEAKWEKSSEDVHIFPNIEGSYIIQITLYNMKKKKYVRLFYGLNDKLEFSNNRFLNKKYTGILLPYLRTEISKIKKAQNK